MRFHVSVYEEKESANQRLGFSMKTNKKNNCYQMRNKYKSLIRRKIGLQMDINMFFAYKFAGEYYVMILCGESSRFEPTSWRIF